MSKRPFHEGGSPVYLIAGPIVSVIIGIPAWRAALTAEGFTPEMNRLALAER
jgi:hypothetical protein